MNKFTHSDSSWSMQLLYQNFETIFLDLSFQRMACWSENSKRSYITSILNGAHPGYLILASVNANAFRNNYFKKLQEDGYQHLSIDGNNRTNCIIQFMNDEFTVTVDNKKLLYSELKVNDKAQFDALRLGIVMYENITKEGCAHVFLSHNESQPLSAQEKRNAAIGKISSYFRELEPKVRKNIKIFDENNKKRANDEFILDILVTETSPSTPVNKKGRDVFWVDNLNELKINKTYLKETLDLLGEFLKLRKFGKQSLDGLAKDFIIIRGIMKQKDCTILNRDVFLSTLADKRTELYNSDNAYSIVNKKGKEELLQYATMVSQPTFGPVLAKRSELLEEILQHLFEVKAISSKTLRYINTSDPSLRKQLYDLQQGICPATKNTITDYLNGQLWEVDHIIPLAKGGDDDISNMQLVDKNFNRTKGARL